MASAKKQFFVGIPLLALGGVGIWMLVNRWESNTTLRLRKLRTPRVANTSKPKPTVTPNTIVHQPTEPRRENKALEMGEHRNLEQEQHSVKKPEETLDDPQKTKEPEDEVPDDLQVDRELPNVVTEDNVVIPPTPKEKVEVVGLECGDATRESDCEVLEDGLNVDIDGDRRENYELADDNEGTFKLRISEDPIFGESFRFIVTKKPIKLKSKNDSSQTITLQKYENYGLEKVGEKVYLTRKLTADQGKIRSLGLSGYCTLPTTESSEPIDYKNSKPTCELTTNQIRSVNFDAKKNGGATINGGSVDLYIQKVNDTETYRGGYKFTFQPQKWVELEINENDKIKPQVRKDFMLKDPDADDLVLEKVWKDENQLLGKFGLNCDEKSGKCTIGESLKIKREDDKAPVTIEDGRKKEKKGEEGEIYLVSKDAGGYYEGMVFTSWGEGGITMESKTNSSSTIKMEELGLYYITKKEKESSPPSYYLNVKKGGVEEMISNYLGINHCAPVSGLVEKKCMGQKNHLRRYRFNDGEGEKKITVNNENPDITIIVSSYQPDRTKYPFGHKFTINPKEDIPIGNIILKANTDNNFKIKKDIANKKLYLVEDR